MKIFISMPMNGKTEEQIKATFEDQSKKLKEQFGRKTKIINSFIDKPVENPIILLAESLKKMSKADVVYFVRDWQQARGCNVEYNVAKMYGKAILEEL